MKYLGFVLLVLSGYAMAEEVYYCSDNNRGGNGFHLKDGEYKRSGFTEEKFKMKLKDDGNIVISKETVSDLYLCSTPYDGFFKNHKNHKSCVYSSHNGETFNFNPDNGRYVRNFSAGYVFNNSDDVFVQIGTCTKF
jgi:hypothetical protein